MIYIKNEYRTKSSVNLWFNNPMFEFKSGKSYARFGDFLRNILKIF